MVDLKDYTEKQLTIWATGKVDLEQWNRFLQEHFSLVSVDDERIVGFGDMDLTGYLDRLYVHKDYQRKGIAISFYEALEKIVSNKIITHASITARPFFENRGYKVILE